MKVTIDNKNITIASPTPSVLNHLGKLLSYTDKSKQFQLRKMGKNPFTRKTQFYKDLEKEVHGSLLKYDAGGSVVIPSGFAHLVSNIQTDDHRDFNGADISLPWKNKPFDLRPYQEEAVELMDGNYRGLINFATGLGKTLTAIYAIRKFKKKTLVLCPGVSIADNFYSELCEAFGENKVGYFGNGKKKIRDITVGIAGSVNNHIEKFKEADLGLIVIDEVHHVPANTFFSIADELGGVGRMFGLTATDFRSDGKDVMITAGVGPVLIKRDLIWGIKHKWLADPYVIMREIDTTGRQFREDKLKNYKEHVLNSKEMNDRILADCQKFIGAGKSVLCLVDQVAHGEMLSEKLGIPFATGKDKKSRSFVNELNAGTIPGLIGTSKYIGEGTDTKNVDVLVLVNFVASKGILWQNLGRGLRIHNGNDQVVVLDYCPAGSTMLERHANQRLKFYEEITSNVRYC
jgi:superfamily II DNA or RNA helicase